MVEYIKKHRETVVFWGCILAHTLLLYKICDFSKALTTYADELSYYNMAKSIFHGHGLTAHGVTFEFQNLAYCYFLVPFFGISNGILRVKVITFANSLLMSLCIVPVWLICKELELKQKDKWLVAALVMIWPDMLTAGTFMSENLYWLMMLSAVYFSIKSIVSYKKFYTIVAAVFCYLSYFCKEVAVCLALTYVAFIVLFPFADRIMDRRSKDTNSVKRWKRSKFPIHYLKEVNWTNLILFGITYAACYVLFKNIIFRDITNLYSSKLDAAFLRNLYDCFYFIYGIVYYILASIVAFMILPVLYPLFYYNRIDRNVRKAFIYALIFLLGIIVVIVFTITVKEDMGKVVPRIHLRYFAPLAGLLLPIFFKAVSDTETEGGIGEKSNKTVICFWGMFWLICFFIFKGVAGGCTSENFGLNYTQFISGKFGNLSLNMNESVIFYLSAIIVNIIIGFVLIVWNAVWLSNKWRRKFSMIVCVSMAIICITNSVWGVSYMYKYYAADDTAIAEMIKINDFFIENKIENSNVLFVCQNWAGNSARIYDTYFDGVKNHEIIYENLMDEMYERNQMQIKISEMDFTDAVLGAGYKMDTIDYFIAGDSVVNLSSVMKGLQLIPEISGDFFYVYKNTEPEKLSFLTDDQSIFAEIEFGLEGYNVPLYVKNGISYCEGGYSWSDGDELQIRVHVPDTTAGAKVQLELAGTFGRQEMVIYQQESIIYESVADGEGIFSFPIVPVQGDCSFKIRLPDATSPYHAGVSPDMRKLGLMIRKVTIIKD